MTSAFITRLVPVLLLAAIPPAAGMAQPAAAKPPAATPSTAVRNVEVDPIRCWWKTSDGAVRIGQTFTLTLTCAVLQNEGVQVVPDETRLGAAVIQMAPFEIVRGSHPADLYTPDRRYFQYEYVMRIINPDEIGRDVRIPDQLIHYRINSKVSQNAALQGKDNTYELPVLEVRLLSTVPNDASDIRDSGNESFGILETLGFRANVLEIVSVAAGALGALFVLLSLVRLILRTRKTKKVAGDRGIAETAILRSVSRELSSVQRDAEGGWSPELVDRALAAARIAAATAVGRPVGQVQNAAGTSGEGRLLMTPWRRKATTVSGGVTTNQLTLEIARLSKAAPPARRQVLEDLQASIASFTKAQYARATDLDRQSLDDAASRAASAAASLRSERMWPKPQIRRWTTRESAAAR